jgi:23S rRNA (cytidine1920-2'-O)/16S rRNA (cytidine1409-2'-O)-methyltransferase
VPEPVDFFSVDVAFISLKLVLPVARNFLLDGGEAVCLIKPQFEAGREKVGKKGVVRDKAVHVEVIESIVDFVLHHGFSVLGLTFSPVKGPEGNIEYLLYLKKTDEPNGSVPDIKELVEQSHLTLNGGERP